MAILEGVLKEEINRLAKNIANYESLLLSLPRGTIFVRKMGESFFAYRRRKENGKVISEYLGNIELEAVQNEIQLSKDYKRIKGNLRISKHELSRLQKAIKVYD